MHQEAKAKQANWLDGYQVIISEVIKSYGDAKLTMLPAFNAQSTKKPPINAHFRTARHEWALAPQLSNAPRKTT
jgi:hypothetical protein